MKSKKKKTPAVVTRPTTQQQAYALLTKQDAQLRRVFESYAILGLRKRPPQEITDTGTDEVLMYFYNGALTVVGCMALDTYISLYMDALGKMGVPVDDKLRSEVIGLVTDLLTELTAGVRQVANAPAPEREHMLRELSLRLKHLT